MKSTLGSIVSFLVLITLAGVHSVNAADQPPSYTLQFLGDGSVVALNNVNSLVGFRTSPTTGLQTPLISMSGAAWAVLPSPTGASSAFPTDINDAGVIVGVATMSSGRRAIRWTPSGAACH